MVKKNAGLFKISLFVVALFAFLLPVNLQADDDNGNSSLVPSGGEGKRLVIAEYSDFQCSYCARVQPAIKKVMENYGDRVELVFMQFPLTGIHPNALISAKASLAALKQEKFWELHDMMFANQKNLSENYLISYAEKIGLDVEQFKKDLNDKDIEAKVMEDIAQGKKLGITGTPTFFIGDTKLVGAVPYEKLSGEIEKKLAELPNYKKKAN